MRQDLKYHVLLCYKNFAKDSVTHIGLGVTAAYSAKTLVQNGIFAEALAIFGGDDKQLLNLLENAKIPITHVVFMAQWIPVKELGKLSKNYSHITFVQKCHSGIAFLQAEPPAITLIRDAIDLEMCFSNFHVACNNRRASDALQSMYHQPITYLPNLYYIHGQEPVHRPLWSGGLLKIGAFGSLRVYKNFSSAIASGIALAGSLKCDAEIWINANRSDGDGNVVQRTATAWTKDLPHVTLKEFAWSDWPTFRRKIGSMNILFQPSFTETFNNVTSDGIVEGICSVVGPSIEWVPPYWIANPDDTPEITSAARRILFDPHAVSDGYTALKNYVSKGVQIWKDFLER